ncbi:hypothetical protein CBL_12388 [Carabus blaptoides fortunei]
MSSYIQNYANSSNIPMYAPHTPANYCRPMLYQQSDPRFKSNTSSSAHVNSIDQKSDDELWIETYLSKIGKINLSLHSNIEIISKKPTPAIANKKTLKIHVAKSLLHRCIKLLSGLEKLEKYLKENVATMSSAEWKQKTIEIGQQKDEFTALLSQFDDSSVLEQLRKTLNKRKKKRLSHKRKKVARREEYADMMKNRQLLHKSIDQWLENMQDNVERTKREEYLKKDADCVLSEVTKKKSDARKQLTILTALVKLRAVREKTALHRGEKISLEDSNAFKHNAERLQNMWENALKTYAIEEQQLRAMLEKNALDEIPAGVSEERKITSEWERLLYGPKIIPCDAYWGLTYTSQSNTTTWSQFLHKDSTV